MKKAIKRVAHYKSESTKGKVYETTRHRDGAITCTCPGFMYTGAKGKAYCKHTKKAIAWK